MYVSMVFDLILKKDEIPLLKEFFCILADLKIYTEWLKISRRVVTHLRGVIHNIRKSDTSNCRV